MSTVIVLSSFICGTMDPISVSSTKVAFSSPRSCRNCTYQRMLCSYISGSLLSEL